ncbi:carcinoembryonic antigen-related cell adhesion molecule 5-like isoform X1 [Sebastes umbrosus]|uniref:carcinoembryonic antigen-related cell adhesion molecule 5-like isoform X1 n=2 Tax=Sebastes umbrosus TaxID=72105 RepID=UPI00189DBFCB|nr:carcinoembryonic antigen-related cell adhesion molecule 5-like isoform X1 [Sebastes umbrosus]
MDLFAFKTLLFLLSFIGRDVGANILPEGDVEVIVGKNVTLKTLLVNPVYSFIIWGFSDGGDDPVNVASLPASGVLKVNDPYIGRVAVNGTNGFLTLTGLKPEDSGDYSINLIKADGSTTTGATNLKVLEPVSDVVIKSDLPEAIEQVSAVVLTCSAKGSFLKFSWLKGTVPFKADGVRITETKAENSNSLTIRDVLRTDLVGPIFCTAANNLESEKSAPFNLTVFYGPEDVTITSKNTPKFVRAKSIFNLTCSAVSSPPADFVWYRNEVMMEARGAMLDLAVIEKLGYGTTEGSYTCNATNPKTKRSEVSPAVTFAVMEAISGAKVSGPTATLIAGNSTANLSCQATAGTVKTVTWLKDGKLLVASGRVVFAADKSSVMINPLQKEDNGEFVCQLSNPVNTDKASFKMMVNYGPEPAMVSGEKAVEVHEVVKLTCSAASVPPANFTWKFNGSMTDVKTAHYDIEEARYKNTGTYTCMAYNDVTGKNTTYTHTLSVKEEGALDEGLSDGAIAGIVIALLVALGAAIGLIVYCRQKVPVESPY